MLINVKAFSSFSNCQNYIQTLCPEWNTDDLCDMFSTLEIQNTTTYADDQSLKTDIQNVMDNCEDSAPRNENYIDKLVETMLRQSGFDSNLFCLGRPKRKNLVVGDDSFSSNADVHVVCKHDNNVILVVENKHANSTTYKAGELQLICHMLASIQNNSATQRHIWGIRVHSCKVYFYFVHCDDVYLLNLKLGKINTSINVARFPCDSRGLSLQYRRERIEIFKILASIKSSF